MNSYNSANHQTQADKPQLLEPGNLPEGAPVEMSFYGPGMELTSLESVERLISFSQKDLRNKYTNNEEELVERVWLRISCLLCDHVPHQDYLTYALGMMNELAAVTGVVISDENKRGLYSQSYPGLNNE